MRLGDSHKNVQTGANTGDLFLGPAKEPRMKTFARVVAVVLCGLLSTGAAAQITAFTYQGKLTDAGNPANGNYDIEFKLFDSASAGTGTQQGGTLVLNPVAASNGIFTVVLDFGTSPFSGAARFLEVGVRPAGSAVAYTTLSP